MKNLFAIVTKAPKVKNILSQTDTLTNKISFYHLCLFLVALPFDQFYSEVLFISFMVHTLIHLRKSDLLHLYRKELLILPSVFLVSVVCTVYSHNKTEAMSLWMRQSTILLFPVLLFLNPINFQRSINKLLAAFAISCTLVVCYLFYDAMRIIHFYHLPLTTLFSPQFINHNFSLPIDIHATYLSLYVALSLTYFIDQFIKTKSIGARIVFVAGSLILLAGLLQLGSRSVLIAVLLIINLVIPIALKGRQRFVYLIASILLTSSICLFIYRIENYKERFVTELQADLSPNSASNETTNSRMKRWEAAFELVKAAPVVGYGTSEETSLLKEIYFEKKFYNAYLNSLNAHNQYISFLLMGGILALLIYLVTLAYGLKTAILSGNIVFISFMILLIVVSVSENILDRNKGIFFYGFFFSFFICLERKKIVPVKDLSKTYSAYRQPSL